MSNKRIDVPPIQQNRISLEEALAKYGDLSLRDFVDEAIKAGMIPHNLLVIPIDELAACPQISAATNTLSVQNGLAA